MNRIIFFLTIVGFLLSCQKDKSLNNTLSDPLNELEWLKDVKESLNNCSCQISILQGTYQNQTVFFILMNDPLCNGAQNIILMNNEGNVVKEYHNDEINEYYNEVEITKTLYVCKED